jgi:lipid II:glycine glycyltransferase (peptidoglycan interpeptide bridge formation enzyme)
LLANLFDYGKRAAWSSIELRWDTSPLDQAPPSYTCYGHTLDLSDNENEAFSLLRDSTRRNIKKAIGAGVKVEVFESMNALEEFYRLNCLTRKSHGLPPQPFRFFKKVYEHVLAKGNGIVVLASHEGTNIAGAVHFHLGKKAIYKYGASDRKFQHLRANNLVMWEAMRWYSRKGFRSLCFGRTERTNEGLLQFKRGWNAKERAIRYYRYDLRRESFVTEGAVVSGGGSSLFRRMPIPLLRMTGSVLYRHIG